MMNLPSTHQWLHEKLQEKAGCWTVQRHTHHGFSSVSTDQTIQQTINKESKTSGGVKGGTLTKGELKIAARSWIKLLTGDVIKVTPVMCY